MANILNNNVRSISTSLYRDKYYDFMLYKGKVLKDDILDEHIVADISFPFDVESGALYSTVIWKNAISEDAELDDIGFTGADNGLISFRKDRISNQDYLDILTGSTYVIESGDTRLFLSPVTGNTLNFQYPIEEGEDYIAFKGGFYQGFYKLYNYNYQTLPNNVDDEWNLYFELRPRTDYELEGDIVNALHPENEGIFFYMGTRAENKFWSFYRMDEDIKDSFKRIPDDNNYTNASYCSGETESDTDFLYNNVTHSEFMQEEEPKEEVKEEYFIDDYTASASSPDCPCVADIFAKKENRDDNFYFNDDEYHIKEDDYIINMGETDCEGHLAPGGDLSPYCKKHSTACGCDNKKSNTNSNIASWFSISDIYEYKYQEDSNCHPIKNACSCGKEGKPTEQTCCCNVDNDYKKECECEKSFFQDDYYNDECYDGPKAIEEEYMEKDIDFNENQIQDSYGHEYTKKGYYEIETDNKFILFNRTKDGFDVNNWIEGTKVILTGRTDFVKDINLFTIMDRTASGVTVNELDEFKEANTNKYDIFRDIKNNAFALRIKEDGSVGYRYAVFDCDSDNHYSIEEEYSKPNMIKADEWNKINIKISIIDGNHRGKRLMQIYFYLDKNLIFVSKPLPEFKFKELNDVYQKQEAVPYSISLGGGTQGLLEAIVPDYYNSTGEKYMLPLERDFCGTFIGDIRGFKFFDGAVNYGAIKNFMGKQK